MSWFTPLPPDRLFAQHASRCLRPRKACLDWLLRARSYCSEKHDSEAVLRYMERKGWLRRIGDHYVLTSKGMRIAGVGGPPPVEWMLAEFAHKVRQLHTEKHEEGPRILGDLLVLADRLAEEVWTCGEWDHDGFKWAMEVTEKEPFCANGLELCQINRLLVFIARTEHFHGYFGGFTQSLWNRGVIPAIGERISELLVNSPCVTLSGWMGGGTGIKSRPGRKAGTRSENQEEVVGYDGKGTDFKRGQ